MKTKGYIITGIVLIVFALVFFTSGADRKLKKMITKEARAERDSIKAVLSDLRRSYDKDTIMYQSMLDTLKNRNVALLDGLDSLKTKRQKGEIKIINYNLDFNDGASAFSDNYPETGNTDN